MQLSPNWQCLTDTMMRTDGYQRDFTYIRKTHTHTQFSSIFSIMFLGKPIGLRFPTSALLPRRTLGYAHLPSELLSDRPNFRKSQHIPWRRRVGTYRGQGPNDFNVASLEFTEFNIHMMSNPCDNQWNALSCQLTFFWSPTHDWKIKLLPAIMLWKTCHEFRLRMADLRDFAPAAAGRACAKSLSSSLESWAWIPGKSSRAVLQQTTSGCRI